MSKVVLLSNREVHLEVPMQFRDCTKRCVNHVWTSKIPQRCFSQLKHSIVNYMYYKILVVKIHLGSKICANLFGKCFAYKFFTTKYTFLVLSFP